MREDINLVDRFFQYFISSLILFAVLRVLVGCGTAPKEDATPKAETAPQSTQTSTSVATTPTPAAATVDPVTPTADTKCDGAFSACLVTGGVDSAFALTVDSKAFADMEQFYSSELTALDAAAADKGYAGYKTDFNAQLGLNDLKYGMDVYVQSASGQGFTGATTVHNDGRFSIAVTDKEPDTSYDIRLNKRISLTLTPPDGGAAVEWCWNFSGTASATPRAPVIVNTFSTSLTFYACGSAAGGMTLPTNPAPAK